MVEAKRGECDPERGKRLEEALRARDVRKMYGLAFEIGVNESAISRWRKGAPIATDNVIRLCQNLDISADWLLLARGHIDQHISAALSREERALLDLIKSLPPPFLFHFTRAMEAVATE